MASLACFTLMSCVSSFSWRHVLSQNVLWSSEDGKIRIYVEGIDYDHGHAIIEANAQERIYQTYFNDSSDGIIFFSEDEMKNNSVYTTELRVRSIKDDNKLEVTFKNGSNGTGDPYYDDYSTVLSSRPLKENELDARYFANSWVNEEKELCFRTYSYNVLTTEKEGTYKGEQAFLCFLEGPRFEMKYETGVVFASGTYVTHFDSMDLSFDEGCGREEFGESLEMLWGYASGQVASPFER